MAVGLITGSCGLVGSEATKFFINKGFDICGVDNNSRKSFFGKDGDILKTKKSLKTYSKSYRHFDLDIRSNKIKKIFSSLNKNIKFIIHCAAQPSHDWAYKDPIRDFDVNAFSTLKLLELTRKYCPDANFIFLSTNKVYGDAPNHLPLIEKKYRYEILKSNKNFNGIDENQTIDNCIHSLFGCSKAYGDIITQEYGKNLGLKTTIFRAGCITGTNHKGAKLHGFLSYLVKSLITNKKYTCIGYKGKQVRDNIHSFDLVNAFWKVYQKPNYGEIFNIGGGRYSNCSILEAINIINRKLSLNTKIKVEKTPRVGDHQWYISNISKFQKKYPDWKISFTIDDIIDELIENNLKN